MLVGLLFGDLEGLEIVTDNSQLLFKLNDLGLTSIGPLFCAVKIGLNHLQFLAMSSYFLSASSAKILASLSWFSRDSIRASSDKALFSSTLHIQAMSSYFLS